MKPTLFALPGNESASRALATVLEADWGRAAIRHFADGESSVCLLSPLQGRDAIFQPGETVAARHFAALLSRHFDWLVTVDPHLHRIASLADIYTIPTQTVQAVPAIASWVRARVSQPFLIGPDKKAANGLTTLLAGARHRPWCSGKRGARTAALRSRRRA